MQYTHPCSLLDRANAADDLSTAFSRFLEAKKKVAVTSQIVEEFQTSAQQNGPVFLLAPFFIEEVAKRIPNHAVLDKQATVYYLKPSQPHHRN